MAEIDDELDSLFDDEPVEKPKEKPKKEEPKEEEPEEKPTEEPKDEPKDEPNEEEPEPEPEPSEDSSPKEKNEEKKTSVPDKPSPKPEPKEEAPPVSSFFDDEEFDTSPDESVGKVVFVVYGKKGHGKTYFSLKMPGKISALSFDRKTQRIARLPEFRSRVVVYDAIKYYDRSNSDKQLETASKSWKYIQKCLERIEVVDKPDWTLIDGGEIAEKMFEMVMRNENNLRPYQGISNFNLWKRRNEIISQLLTKAVEISKYGVIWTSYVTTDGIKADGDWVVLDEVPKWIEKVLYETDVVARVFRKTTKNGQRYSAVVESSKIPEVKDTPVLDVTNDGIMKVLPEKFIETLDEQLGDQ